ncbi:MAG: carboxypeptidase-like regulatory domain-containing protein [Prevotella sp.]|nr:carboxypeptidase-like regulatory domain-containing protein [Prevotella sp.]
MRITMLLAVLMYSLLLSAQRQLRVVDVETLMPVAGTNVVTKESTAQTDSMGCITVSDSCRTLVFSHVNYESRMLNLEEVKDTVYLISKLLNLKEVVVFGQDKRGDKIKDLKNQLGLSKTDAQLIAANPASGMNLFGLIGKLIPKKWRKSKKESRRERLKRVIEEY